MSCVVISDTHRWPPVRRAIESRHTWTVAVAKIDAQKVSLTKNSCGNPVQTTAKISAALTSVDASPSLGSRFKPLGIRERSQASPHTLATATTNVVSMICVSIQPHWERNTSTMPRNAPSVTDTIKQYNSGRLKFADCIRLTIVEVDVKVCSESRDAS